MGSGGVDNIFLPQNRDVPEQNKSNDNLHHRRLHLTACRSCSLCDITMLLRLVLMRGIMDQFLIRDECIPDQGLVTLSISTCTGLARSASSLVYLWHQVLSWTVVDWCLNYHYYYHRRLGWQGTGYHHYSPHRVPPNLVMSANCLETFKSVETF